MFIIILSTNINTKTNIITVFNDIFYVTFLVIRQRHGVDRNGRSGQILVFFYLQICALLYYSYQQLSTLTSEWPADVQ